MACYNIIDSMDNDELELKLKKLEKKIGGLEILVYLLIAIEIIHILRQVFPSWGL